MRKTTFLIPFTIAALLSATATAQTPAESAGTIIVEIDSLRNSNGQLLVTLHPRAKHFLKEPPADGFWGKEQISNRSGRAYFTKVPAGNWAVAVFHDENSNGKLDLNFFGLPREGVGTSNNPKGRMGPPTWEDARFTHSGDTVIVTVHMRYLF